jgi:hypothetical protein
MRNFLYQLLTRNLLLSDSDPKCSKCSVFRRISITTARVIASVVNDATPTNTYLRNCTDSYERRAAGQPRFSRFAAS